MDVFQLAKVIDGKFGTYNRVSTPLKRIIVTGSLINSQSYKESQKQRALVYQDDYQV